MKTLEEEILKFENAEKKLHAKKIEVRGSGAMSYHGNWSSWGQYECDYSENEEYDRETNKEGKDELEKLYSLSQWFTVRYKAGKALKKPRKELRKVKKKYLTKLSEELKVTNINRLTKAQQDLKGLGYGPIKCFIFLR